MPFSGGGFGNLPQGQFQQKNLMDIYKYTFDAEMFTKILLFAGYRPYQLERDDTGEIEVVWAKPDTLSVEWEVTEYRTKYDQRDGTKATPKIMYVDPDLSRYAKGKVTSLTVQKGMGVSQETIVLIHDDDGGYVNILGVKQPLPGQQSPEPEEEKVPETA